MHNSRPRPDPLYDVLKRDIRSYHRMVQGHVMRRLEYDRLRYGTIDEYMDARRRGLYRAAKMSAQTLDDSSERAAMRARLVLDAVYEDIVRDLLLLQKDIRDLAEENRIALEELRRLETRKSPRPEYYDSFDIFTRLGEP